MTSQEAKICQNLTFLENPISLEDLEKTKGTQVFVWT